jgi:hypothetical protein
MELRGSQLWLDLSSTTKFSTLTRYSNVFRVVTGQWHQILHRFINRRGNTRRHHYLGLHVVVNVFLISMKTGYETDFRSSMNAIFQSLQYSILHGPLIASIHLR